MMTMEKVYYGLVKRSGGSLLKCHSYIEHGEYEEHGHNYITHELSEKEGIPWLTESEEHAKQIAQGSGYKVSMESPSNHHPEKVKVVKILTATEINKDSQ